jgi:predicted HNH restriction endonuclease
MQVHHIRPLTTHPEMAFHGSNLMSVCTACHAKLSVEERA